ncbi:MAG: CdaR family protein [Acidobacteriota bacterium]|jgi:YbbR domain-containing protein|nr:CdaR family protein [Acidobacteriota bacterium]
MNIRRFLFKNFGLRMAALAIAVLVWILITGKQRTFEEKTFEVPLEYFNVSNNIDVRTVRPDQVRIKVRGTTKEIRMVAPEDLRLRVDLAGVNHGKRMNLFTEDYLKYPPELEVISVHPKMIEVEVEEFMRKEVPIRVRYRGRMSPGVVLLNRTLNPEKVTVFGYKSQIQNVTMVNAERDVQLDRIERTRTIRIPLQKTEEILRFEDTDTVEVTIEVENRNAGAG